MFKRKKKHYIVLTPVEATLALRALLSFRNKILARRVDTVDVDGLIKKLT